MHNIKNTSHIIQAYFKLIAILKLISFSFAFIGEPLLLLLLDLLAIL